MTPGMPRVSYAHAARIAIVAGTILTALFAVNAVVHFGGTGTDQFFAKGVENVVLCLASLVIVGRGLAVRRERWAWVLLGTGLLSWTAANTYYSLFIADLDPVPIPSVADGLWLGFYPFAYLAIVMIVRSRLKGLRRGMWLDGLIGAAAIGAVSAAVVVETAIAGGLSGTPAAIATNLAYPLGDLILLGVATVAIALNGWRLDATWTLLGVGFLLFATADGIYLVKVAAGTYVAGSLMDTGWLAAAMLFAAAALRTAPARRESRSDGQRMLLVPCLFGLLGLGMLVFGNLASINRPALVLATTCVLGVICRMAMTFWESRRESLTDALTDLPNRRSLVRDLRSLAPQASDTNPLGLVFFDLNGFKRYNDRFGHHAGDALLVRLSRRLGTAVDGHGTAYRMGGDEFCALIRGDAASVEAVVCRGLAALTDQGDGFRIDSAHGLVQMPIEGTDPERALRLADQRMYAMKNGGRVSPELQTSNALMQMLSERYPDLGDRSDGVAELARETGRRLGLDEHRLEEVALAARLHDIGKAAVPDAILHKPGPLDADEWEIMKRHSAIGERILRAAPALEGVAAIVRSTHERVDGSGYPDGLCGEQILLGARIVGVCDAFDAIISNRPYSTARTPNEAVAELRRCAGSHFDPDVVEAFVVALAERARVPEGIAPS
jgi:two-component system, cell cycle response regulator